MNLTIYFNGQYKTVTPDEFERLLPGFLEGKGAFETMRLYDGKIFAFDDHMKRLSRGLNHFKLALPLSHARIKRIVARLSLRNNLNDSRVRIIVWHDKQGKNISISTQPLSLASSKKYREGYTLMTTVHRRNRTRHSHVKSINYKMFRRAFQEAQLKGFDEALLLNQHGELVEGTRTNIFFVKNNILQTPAIRCGALNGITRQRVITCARELKIPVRTVRVRLPEVVKADEAFLTGSTLEIMPIKSIDHHVIGKKRPGPITKILQQAYSKMVRHDR